MSTDTEMNRMHTNVYVLATNASGEPELLHFASAPPQAEYDDGKHYDAARSAVKREGYTPLGVFDQNDPAGKRLPELAIIQACAPARSASSESNAPLAHIEAYAADKHGAGPSFGTVRADEALLGKLLELQLICKQNGLSEARVFRGCDWGPEGIEDELRLQNHELVVVDDQFWFRADVKPGDYHVETRAQNILTFVNAVRQHAGDEPLCFGDLDDDDWQDLLSDSEEDEDAPEGMSP